MYVCTWLDFVLLAATGFGDTTLATDMALGAEHRVRFKATGVVRRGFVDSFYENLIIEFEPALEPNRDHALDQLRNYVSGAWREDGSTRRPYQAVVSDGRSWEVYAPSLVEPTAGPTAENIQLQLLTRWSRPEPDAVESLREFLNRLFFRKALIRPIAANFAADFGLTSAAYAGARATLAAKLDELADDSQLGILRESWSASLQIAYGSVSTDDDLLAQHTYLAVLSRLLVWAAMERRPFGAEDLGEVLTGRYFVGKKIANLVEEDFFRWHEIPSATDASRVWVALARQLAGYDLESVSQDVLKPLYEELVDPATRSLLGEYYTPDWLAALVTDHLLDQWDWSAGDVPSILDPACGSGSFLRAAVNGIRGRVAEVGPADLLDALLAAVKGIDVHPLAVTISRATYRARDQGSAAVRHPPGHDPRLPGQLASDATGPPVTDSVRRDGLAHRGRSDVRSPGRTSCGAKGITTRPWRTSSQSPGPLADLGMDLSGVPREPPRTARESNSPDSAAI